MADSSISKELVRHIAKLAKLELTDEELDVQTQNLASIMGYMAEIRDLDVSAVSGTARVTEEENVFRDDVVQSSLTQEQALQNAPKIHDGYFVVPAVFDSDDR